MGLSFDQISRDANHAAYDIARHSQFGQEDQIWIEDTSYSLMYCRSRQLQKARYKLSMGLLLCNIDLAWELIKE